MLLAERPGVIGGAGRVDVEVMMVEGDGWVAAAVGREGCGGGVVVETRDRRSSNSDDDDGVTDLILSFVFTFDGIFTSIAFSRFRSSLLCTSTAPQRTHVI